MMSNSLKWDKKTALINQPNQFSSQPRKKTFIISLSIATLVLPIAPTLAKTSDEAHSKKNSSAKEPSKKDTAKKPTSKKDSAKQESTKKTQNTKNNTNPPKNSVSPTVANSTPTTDAKNQSVDWTPVLNTMQNGCDLPDINNAPPPLIASIVADTGDRKDKVADGYKLLVLKNAKAWGYPIKKIQYGSMGAGFSSATVYFTDSKFLSLRNKFYLNTVVGKLRASDKTVVTDSNAFAGQALANGMGYNDGRVGVNFSTKTNSITCSWAHLTS